MYYLILVISLFSSVTWAEQIPLNMTHTSMQSIHQRSNLIADVTIEHPLEDKVVFIMGDEDPLKETSMLHSAKVTAIEKSEDIPERFIPKVGDSIIVSQWKDPESGLTYEGTPVLQEGFDYRLYLSDSHGKYEGDKAVYIITGINGGLFSREGADIYRDTLNTSALE